MNACKVFLMSAALACSFSTLHAQEASLQSGVHTIPLLINDATSETGTLLKQRTVYGSKFPLDKTYEQLTPEQKAEFQAMYESMPPGDEPPFPLEGLKSVVGAIKKAQAQLKARGEINLTVTVGPDGKAKQVADYGKLDNPEMSKFAATVLLMTRFKPAVCAGTPCTMQFPFNLKLRGS